MEQNLTSSGSKAYFADLKELETSEKSYTDETLHPIRDFLRTTNIEGVRLSLLDEVLYFFRKNRNKDRRSWYIDRQIKHNDFVKGVRELNKRVDEIVRKDEEKRSLIRSYNNKALHSEQNFLGAVEKLKHIKRSF